MVWLDDSPCPRPVPRPAENAPCPWSAGRPPPRVTGCRPLQTSPARWSCRPHWPVAGSPPPRPPRCRGQVHGVLGLVGQVRAAVLHLGDLGVRVVGLCQSSLLPLCFRCLSAGPNPPAWACRCPSLGQALKEVVVALARVLAHDGAQGRVGSRVVPSMPTVLPLISPR